jgi:acetylornithine/succinyldiaminopimelate/putrescine aminotransferase
LHYGVEADLEQITEETACVVVEPVQAEAGAIFPDNNFLKKLRRKCNDFGVILIYDEVQTGFGRTGKMFGFEHSETTPDIIVFAKGLGGGMPIGAFVSSAERMTLLTHDPVLGHITTFGGHPVSCAAALATIEVIQGQKLHLEAARKEQIIRTELQHNRILELRGRGLMLAAVFDSFETNKKIIDKAIELGVITDWFLFCDHAMRIAPPLNIADDVLIDSCGKIVKAIDQIQ